MDKNVAISRVVVRYSEKPSRILFWDLFLPVLITVVLGFVFWKYLGPLLFGHLYRDFNLGHNPRPYHLIRALCYDYFQYVGFTLGALVFCVLSFQGEFPPGPGRLVRVFIRRWKKRSELQVEKKFEDLSHPGPFDFQSPEVIAFSKSLRQEGGGGGWKEPWTQDPSNILLGNLRAFDPEKRGKFRHVVLETKGRNLHTAVIGASGSGKTVSYIGPTLALDSLNPRIGTFCINPKGDLKLKRFALAGVHQDFRRSGTFKNRIQVISFQDKKNSLLYDPFLFGREIDSSLNIQNKICGSFVFQVEFYKTMAQNFVGKFAAIMATEPKLQNRLTLRHLVYYMGNPQAIAYLREYIEDSINKENLNFLMRYNPENLLGIQSHLSTFVDNADLAHIFDDFSRPCVNLVDTIQESGNVFVEVDTISKGGVSKSFGKMLIRDLQVMASKRDSGAMPMDNFISVNIDEFGSFAYPDFIDFLDKGRSSGFMIALAFQDLANLQKEGLPISFQNEVLGNTSNKFFFRLADNKVSQYASDFIGSRYAETEVLSFSTSSNTLADSHQGSRGVRYQKELMPYILPSDLQRLRLGQCYVKFATGNPNHGPVSGAASIGLFPDEGMPSPEEVRKYMELSFAASRKHPGWDRLLPVTNDFDPYGPLRNSRVQEPILTPALPAGGVGEGARALSPAVAAVAPVAVLSSASPSPAPGPLAPHLDPARTEPELAEDQVERDSLFTDFLKSDDEP